MSFSISSIERDADNTEDVIVTDDALDILANILEEEGVEVLEEAIEVAKERNAAVRGKEIREVFFED